jgi:cytochrome P450
MAVRGTREEYSLRDPALAADPYGGFGRIRKEAPAVRGVLWDGGPVWIVTRYEEVSAILQDRRFVSNAGSLPGRIDEEAAFMHRFVGIPADVLPYLTGNLVYLDPPDHTRLRGLVAKAFTFRRVTKLRPRVTAITARLLDTLPGLAVDGVVELIEDFAVPLPVEVICEALGVPEAERQRWHVWSRRFIQSSPQEIVVTVGEMNAEIREMAARRAAEPADDLLTALVEARDDASGRLSEAELVTMVLTLMIAGHTTTSHLLANGIAALLAHPEQLAALRADPAGMPGAVQEILRWCSPSVLAKLRYASEDVTIGDTPIRQGERVQLVLGSANRDERRFPDGDRLDVRRPAAACAHHLAYARGPHHCLGAALANQEAEVAFSALFTRFPELALAVPYHELERTDGPVFYRLARLPVTL